MRALIPSIRPAVLPTSLSLLAMALAAAAQAQTTVSGMSTAGVLKQATLVGKVPAATIIKMSITLKPRDRAGMEAMANRVSNPKSADYHRFLSPAEIGEKFGASVDTVNATVSFLKSKGMTVTMIADNHMAILFKGRADKVESAFTTKLNNYRLATKAANVRPTFFANTTAPKVPVKIAPFVQAITGLDNASKPSPRSTLSPSQTRTLYNAAGLYDDGNRGEGINVGITNFDGYLLSNLPLFYSTYGLTPPAGGVGSNVTKVSVDGFDGETAAAQGEGDLDIQLALAIAPRCNLYIYDCNDFVATAVQQAQDNIVDIVSESYGHITDEDHRAAIQSAHDQHVAMTIQGITYLLATGDYGTDLLGFDYPNFDPEILQVGGTVATVDNQGNRITEVGWDGSGAGWSTFDIAFNSLPSWLVGSTVPTNTNRRIFPDVALHAFGGTSEGYDFVYGGSLSAVSGTSASSPTFAGQLAIMLQQLSADGAADISSSGRPRLGRLQDFLYSQDGDPTIFLDIMGGDAGVLADGTEAVGKPGWDYVTGWGAPNLGGLYDLLSGGGVVDVPRDALSTTIYHPSSPNITFGTSPSGGSVDLASADGLSYSLQSIKQSGVGQVAAVNVGFTLTGDPAKRRSAGLVASVSLPSLTTGYLYLKNYQTGAYDVVATITGTGVAKAVEVKRFNMAKYIGGGGTVDAMVRGLKPTRLGSTPFRLVVDRLQVIERLPSNSL